MNDDAPKSLRDALAFIARYIEAPLPPVRRNLSAAFGHVLAENIAATVSLPRFDNSAMDGFAVRSSDAGPEESLFSRLRGRSLRASQPRRRFTLARRRGS